jgi:hypothetical protein
MNISGSMDAINPLFFMKLGAVPQPILATIALMHESEAREAPTFADMECLDHSDLDRKLPDADSKARQDRTSC